MRRLFRQVLTLSTLSALAGCGETRNPLGPADSDESASTAEAVPTGDLAALTTSRILFASYNADERANRPAWWH